MPVTGPDFISLQVRDLAASQSFYEHYLGLVRSPAGPPHAVVFATTPIAFAVRDLAPGTDLAGVEQPGIGTAAVVLRGSNALEPSVLASRLSSCIRKSRRRPAAPPTIGR